MKKYMHIERLGMDEVDGILAGNVFIMPKLDGANGQIYFDSETEEICCASRRKELNHELTNQGFWNYVFDNVELFTNYFKLHPYHILYGEWLVPHTLRTYNSDSWKRFYVFDIFDTVNQMWIPYPKYVETLKELGIPFIPVIGELFNPTHEKLNKYLENNTYLIQDGKGAGEGIVIKNYDFVNRYGRTIWAKLVRNEFKEAHIKEMGHPQEKMLPLEYKIANEFITEGRLNKIKAKMREGKPFTSKRIPEYFGRVWFEIIQDEMWNILKRYKNPIINFKNLYNFIINKIKEVDTEVF